MSDAPPTDEHLQQENAPILAAGMDRRQFMARAALLGLTAATAPIFIAASQPKSPPARDVRFPDPTPFDGPEGEPFSQLPSLFPEADAPLDEASRISHLLWRAGFGASPGRAGALQGDGSAGHDRPPGRFRRGRRQRARGTARGAGTRDLEQSLNQLQRWWLQRMAYTARPLQEKMTLFWHGILTGSFKIVGRGPYMIEQNNLFREKGMGRYDELLKAVSRDPAMMIYLDSRSNKKAAPNENYSRELMELFSLGIGHYTEEDVRESARAFTGWQFRRRTGFYLNERQHDNGLKTFLGRTGNFDGDDIVDIIMEQPAAAEYVCTRLWTFFAYPDPEPEVIERPRGRLQDERHGDTSRRPGDARVRRVLRQPRQDRAREIAGRARGGRGARARHRDRFQAARQTHRADGTGALHAATTLRGGREAPPGSTARRCCSASTWPARSRRRAPTGCGSHPQDLVSGQGLSTSGEIVDFFDDLLLGGRLGDTDRDVLTAFLDNMDGTAVSLDQKIRNVVYLMLASPDFQVV